MDRYLTWLMVGGEEIFRTSSPKLVTWGIVLTMIIVLFLAISGYPVWV